jgi:hypothetical protein
MVNLKLYYSKVVGRLSPHKIHFSGEHHQIVSIKPDIYVLYNRRSVCLMALIGNKTDIKELLKLAKPITQRKV